MNEKSGDELMQTSEQLMDFIICLEKATILMKSKSNSAVDELAGSNNIYGGG